KDILIPAHGIYWLIMLHAIGFPDEAMPQLLVHGWWNLGGAKMSKSAGNVIDPFVLADKYGAEALRYYLMSDIATGRDSDFDEDRLISCFNSDLANSVGNLVNRCLVMVRKYRKGRLSKPPAIPEKIFDIDDDLNNFKISSVLGVAVLVAQSANGLIEVTAPWKAAEAERQGSEEAKKNLDYTLYNLIERIRIVAVLISPVLPKAAHGIFDQLNWKMELSGKEERFSLADAEWGKLPDGHVVGQPVPLFPRIETT
ncbi:MAG TPA: class I tRNA ligase family protein, partial [Chthoniobacterales bacterium]|nr:class I tRNA ligase family protein [Chthoniobacterales bacterium]